MSIRRYLVLTLFSMLTLITFIAAIQGYKESMSKAEEQFDHQLLDLAHTLLAIHSASKSALESVQGNNFQVTEVDQQGGFAFQVWENQQLVVKSNNAPDHRITSTNLIDNKSVNFYEVNFLNQRWRALFIANQLSLTSPAVINVIVAQPLQTQFALAQSLILAAVTPMIIAIVILSVLIFIIITQGLKPLHQLRFELSQRKSNDFSPLMLQVDNTELADVVITLNDLFTRLDAAFQRERHFASDAAHELKTPLSVLKINTHNLIQDLNKRLAESDKQTQETNIEHLDSIQALTNSVDRMGHVIDQILNLNRTNSTQMLNAFRSFNLNLCLKEVIAELYSDIYAKDQTITLVSDDVLLSAHELSVHLLAVNLISNANKYTPIGGEIIVSVNQAENKEITLCVEDSGNGISPDEYQRVFDRFYRVGGDQHNSSALGCGLGLTIVKHIADLHGAKIQLSPSPLLKGLKIAITFPVESKGQEPCHD